jgi:hypothetical protein
MHRKGDRMNNFQKILFVILSLSQQNLYAELRYAQDRFLPRYDAHYNADVQWTIVGGGPAGIIVIGVLIDLGTDPQQIMWVDPKFNVGRMGEYYGNVPGNAKTTQFIEFLNSCKTFGLCNSPAREKLYQLDQDTEYSLQVIVEPLQEITDYLRTKVKSRKDSLRSLSYTNDVWYVSVSNECFTSAHIILATGSHPKKLDYDCKNEIPLDMALNKECLAQCVDAQDTIAIIGSAQSAILLLKYLSELPVGRFINFYRHPLDFDPLSENSLKGMTARWARDVLLKTPPVNLLRIYNSCEALKAWLPICTKIIYAVGFERNDLPPISCAPNINFNDPNGVIGPRLFGIGIAFPEKYESEQGKIMSRIGLVSFMEYAQEMLPQWMALKSLSPYEKFEDLFMIELL